VLLVITDHDLNLAQEALSKENFPIHGCHACNYVFYGFVANFQRPNAKLLGWLASLTRR
jgi:hypothetical protein